MMQSFTSPMTLAVDMECGSMVVWFGREWVVVNSVDGRNEMMYVWNCECYVCCW
jgi:hypothetical protein